MQFTRFEDRQSDAFFTRSFDGGSLTDEAGFTLSSEVFGGVPDVHVDGHSPSIWEPLFYYAAGRPSADSTHYAVVSSWPNASIYYDYKKKGNSILRSSPFSTAFDRL